MDLKRIIESLLFVADRPIKAEELARQTGKKKEEILKAIAELREDRKDAGIILLEQNESYLLSTHPENSELVKDFLSAELREKLTPASLETLAIIAYKQPVSRAEIEAIRGVNSQYTIRLLMMRGLIEKTSETHSRMAFYRTTHEFLQHLGLRDIKELPDFEELTAKVHPPPGFEISSAGDTNVTDPEGGPSNIT